MGFSMDCASSQADALSFEFWIDTLYINRQMLQNKTTKSGRWEISTRVLGGSFHGFKYSREPAIPRKRRPLVFQKTQRIVLVKVRHIRNKSSWRFSARISAA